MTKHFLSIEEVAFQSNKNFGLALEGIFTEMMSKELTNKEAQDQYGDKISSVIFDFTNININADLLVLDIPIWLGPMLESFSINNGHILSHSYVFNALKNKDADDILDSIKEGSVNTFNHKTGKVTGIVSDVCKNRLILRWSDLNILEFTPQELTAVVLHEIGHATAMYEYTGHITTSNMILAALLKTSTNDSVEERKYIFKKVADIIGGNANFDGLETIKDKTVITTTVIDAYYEERVSMNGSSFYDKVTYEQVADQYCSRMGYSKHFAVALDKFENVNSRENGDYSRNKKARLSAQVFSIVTTGLFAVAGIATALLPLDPMSKAGIGSILVMYAGKLLCTEVENFNTPKLYDSCRVRLMRLREDSIIYLKNSKLSKQQIKDKLHDIEEIDKVISKYLVDDYKPIYTVIFTWFNKKKKNNQKSYELQRLLEELSANDLFLQSAKLRSLGSEGIVDYVKGMFSKNDTTNTKELIAKLIETVQKSNYRDNLSYVSKRNVVGNSPVNIVKHFNELVDYSRKHIALHNKYIDFKKNIMAVYAKAIKNNTSLRVASSEIYDLEERYINAVVKMRLLPSKELAYDDDDNTVCTTSRSHELVIYNADLNPKLKESSLYKSADRVSLGIKLSEFNELKELLLTILSNEENYEDSVEKLYASKALQNNDFKIIKEFIDGNGDTELKEIEKDLKKIIIESDKRDTYEIGGFGNLLKELTDILAKPIY